MRLSPSAPFRTTANAWTATAAVSLLFAIGLTAAPIATADTCDNATLRAQNNSTALPDCRAYEMVSAPYKEGFYTDPGIVSFTDDGVVSYQSPGNFAGNPQGSPFNPYHAERLATGWTTTALSPPDLLYNTGTNPALESPDLRWTIWRMTRRDLPGDTQGFWLRGSDGVFTRISDSQDGPAALRPLVGWSADFSHLVVSIGSHYYEYVGTGNDGPPRAVGVDNHGQQLADTCIKDVSADGRVIVFGASCPGIRQVMARVAGSVTVAVSGSECTRPFGDPDGACNGASAADYAGKAADGSRVFFTTSQQLVNGDIDQTSDLYACDIPAGTPAPVGAANPCETLTRVSGTASGAQVENVVRISEDGSRAYFVAQGAVLADNLGVKDVAAVAGQPNLYVWTKDAAHPAGQVRFVTKLAGNDLERAQLTPDNRYLLFSTASSLVGEGLGTDTDGVRDMYRYDASSHSIVRVSTSVSGSGGNDPGFDVSFGLRSLMSADGSTVVFDTAEALSLSDTNGVTDAYAWRDGQVSLISAGGGNSVGVSPSGRDIFFTTDAQVLAVDGDANKDIYTARVGGGFDPLRLPAPCSGDECRGQRSQPPSLAGPLAPVTGSDGLNPLVLSLRAVTVEQRRRLAATGKVTVTVVASAAGRVSATARAKIAGRLITVGSGRRTMTRPGSVAVTLKLSRKARAQLAARGRLTVKVVVSHSKASKGRSVTLRLTRARAKSSSVGGRS